MPKTINLKATLEQTKGRITMDYLARQMVRGTDTIRKWVRGSKIPDTAIDRLEEVLQKNEVEIIYND